MATSLAFRQACLDLYLLEKSFFNTKWTYARIWNNYVFKDTAIWSNLRQIDILKKMQQIFSCGQRIPIFVISMCSRTVAHDLILENIHITKQMQYISFSWTNGCRFPKCHFLQCKQRNIHINIRTPEKHMDQRKVLGSGINTFYYMKGYDKHI